MKILKSPEVDDALSSGKPVVALESTIISHGMPYPKNLETALEVESVVREHGAVPATCAILDGALHVGMTRDQIEFLAKTGSKVVKCSRRDIGFVVEKKVPGATTVAGTMICAKLAGIKVFVTGGIGGVHRGVQETMDISADLTELGRTPVAVVSAGVKTILDIEKTLEYLETQGVAVITYGEKQFPSFFVRDSGIPSPMSVNDIDELGGIVSAQLELESGVVIAVPIPVEDEADGRIIQEAIDGALRELKEQSIKGKEITPFLLKRVNELTEGKSLASNIKLVKNNAKIGALLAASMCRISKTT